MTDPCVRAKPARQSNVLDRRKFVLGVAAIPVAVAMLPRRASASSWRRVRDLDEDASQWDYFIDPPDRESATRWSITNARGLGHRGLDLRVAIEQGGAIPYTGVLASRVAAVAPVVARVELRCWWRFGTTTWNNDGGPSRVQAVELAMNHWRGDGQRFEWALQWSNVGDGSPEQGIPPTWRLWTGTTWQDTGVRQLLSPNKWHAFRLTGSIVNDQVHYDHFSSRGKISPLGQSFDPRPLAGGDELTVTFQLDGNANQDAYACRFDRVSLGWTEAARPS